MVDLESTHTSFILATYVDNNSYCPKSTAHNFTKGRRGNVV